MALSRLHTSAKMLKMLFHLQKDFFFFFAYLQVLHFVNTDMKLTQDETLFGPIEKIMINFILSKGFISYSYNRFQSCTLLAQVLYLLQDLIATHLNKLS